MFPFEASKILSERGDLVLKLADFAEQLRQARNAHRFSRLVLVAGPKFLGMLSAGLDGPTADMVVGRVTKDLAKTPDRDVAAHVQDVLAV